jgi:hypothetical protein
LRYRPRPERLHSSGCFSRTGYAPVPLPVCEVPGDVPRCMQCQVAALINLNILNEFQRLLLYLSHPLSVNIFQYFAGTF